MKRKAWVALGLIVGVSLALGCSSNPVRPAFFQKNRDTVAGPELGTPMDGPYLSGDAPGMMVGPNPNFPSGPVVPGGTYPPGTLPPGTTQPPPQIPSFPPTTLPQGPTPVPQGPPPRAQTTNGPRNSS